MAQQANTQGQQSADAQEEHDSTSAGGNDTEAQQPTGLDLDTVPGAKVVLPSGPKTLLPQGDVKLDRLLRLWGVFGGEIEASCDNLRIGDLRCWSGRGTLATLARFNRPAILILSYGGRTQRVLINKLSETHATLVGSDGVRRISRKQLARIWGGEFELIWRTHAGVTLIRRGMNGSAVVWLRQQLAAVSGEKQSSQQDVQSQYFGRGVESRVRNFQLMHGLKPDGLVGPRTQIMLNSVTSSGGVPTLAPTSEDES